MRLPECSLALTLGLALAAPALADRLQARVECSPADAELTYACLLQLERAGAPVEGAVFTVKPDMPSMPMAHNIAPVPAEPTGTAGAYSVRLQLDMHGRWLLRLDVTEPARDVVILDHEFLPSDPDHAAHDHEAMHADGEHADDDHGTMHGD